jgi:phospholipase/lecithinase/hemolysin
MKKQLVMLGFVTLSTLIPSSAWAAKFNQLYVFGDSLSDTGNFFQATGQPPAPYFNGRFSNGPVWVEYLADSLKLSLNQSTNFAFAGANTGALNTLNPSFPGLQQQIQNFASTHKKADKNALYVVWAGANDYLGGGQTDPTKPVGNLSNAIASLTKVGARNILVANLPNLGALPGTSNNPNAAAGLKTLTGFHNQGLNTVLGGLGKQPGLNIFSLDVNGLFQDAIAGKNGFANVTDAALTTCFQSQPVNPICSDTNNFLFWDAIHPTTKAHNIIANAAFKEINSRHITPVPESSTNWGMLGLAVVGAAGIMKRQLHRNQLTINR